MAERSKYQQKVIKNYYDNREAISLQRLSELVTELYLAEAIGCVGKPMLRVHTAGSVGGSTAIVASVTGIREGALTAAVRTESLPTYFQPPPPAPIQVPGAATEVRIPLTLPTGGNNPNLYLGYGDSITYGDGSSDKQGYVLKLQNLQADGGL